MYRYRRLRYTFRRFCIISYSIYRSQTSPSDLISSVNIKITCPLSLLRCATVVMSVVCQNLFSASPNRRFSSCGEKSCVQGLKKLFLHLSEIISVPNCSVIMSEFPSPGEERSHGKKCHSFFIFLPFVFTFLTFCCTMQNISKKHLYMLHKFYESLPISHLLCLYNLIAMFAATSFVALCLYLYLPTSPAFPVSICMLQNKFKKPRYKSHKPHELLPTSHLFCLYFSILMSAATLLVAPCLYLYHIICILIANNCTISCCNGSTFYRE
jgi:hypothetical protein